MFLPEYYLSVTQLRNIILDPWPIFPFFLTCTFWTSENLDVVLEMYCIGNVMMCTLSFSFCLFLSYKFFFYFIFCYLIMTMIIFSFQKIIINLVIIDNNDSLIQCVIFLSLYLTHSFFPFFSFYVSWKFNDFFL